MKAYIPKTSLQFVTDEHPLQTVREKIGLNCYYKVKSLLNPIIKIITPEQKKTLYSNRKTPPSFAIRIRKLQAEIILQKKI